MAKAKKKATPKKLEKRMGRLSKKQQKSFALARKAAAVFNKSRAGGKLTKSDARTLAKLRKYKKAHRRKMTPEMRKRLKAAARSYTPAKRKRAAKIAWLKRRKKYGKVGRADASTFKTGKRAGAAKRAKPAKAKTGKVKDARKAKGFKGLFDK